MPPRFPPDFPDRNGKPLTVYILAGQANMQGQAKVETNRRI
jgi:hypothetical protein